MSASRRGRRGFPLFRTILLVALVGLVLIGGGVASFLADQQSRRQPLEVSLYPGAERWGQDPAQTETSRSVFYRVAGASVETVANFYQDALIQHNGSSEERCVRIPAEGQFPPEELQPGFVPYYFKCLFDRSGLGTTQYTEVIIMPGLPSSNPEYNTEGMTVVRYNQTWQP
jgi:hypothetical protein